MYPLHSNIPYTREPLYKGHCWTLTSCPYQKGVLNSEVIQYVHTTVLHWEPDCYPYYDDFINSEVYSGEVSLQYIQQYKIFPNHSCNVCLLKGSHFVFVSTLHKECTVLYDNHTVRLYSSLLRVYIVLCYQ